MSIPSELKVIPQWVLWKRGLRDGKITKIPYQVNGLFAKSNDPDTWSGFAEVLAAYRGGWYNGLGLCFGGEVAGIDLDGCFDDAHTLKPWAADILDDLAIPTYAELSPSGKGLHLLYFGALPDKLRGKRFDFAPHVGLEFYGAPSNRYFTVTGRLYGAVSTVTRIEPVDLMPVYYYLQEVLPPKPSPPAQPSPQIETLRGDDDIIRMAGRARNSAKVIALLHGDTAGYESASQADAALCAALTFYTRDATQIDRIFRRSGLYREKWDAKHYSNGATYGQVTIEKALALNGGAA